MEMFLQYTADGSLKGMLYGIIALSFIVIYRAGRIINMAQGEIVTIGGFLIWTSFSYFGLPPWLALILSFALGALLGLLLERGVFRPMIGQSLFSILMVTIGLMILLQGFIELIWGGGERPFPFVFSEEPVILGPFIFNRSLFWGAAISFFLVITLAWFFDKTRWGLRLSAVAEDHQISQSMGISVKQAIALAWVIGCLLSFFAAIVFLNGSSVSFTVSIIGIRVLPVVLLAGLESIWGAPLAGIIVGLGETWAGAYLNPVTDGIMSEAFPYIIMLLILLIRPHGLFGWKTIERV